MSTHEQIHMGQYMKTSVKTSTHTCQHGDTHMWSCVNTWQRVWQHYLSQNQIF